MTRWEWLLRRVWGSGLTTDNLANKRKTNIIINKVLFDIIPAPPNGSLLKLLSFKNKKFKSTEYFSYNPTCFPSVEIPSLRRALTLPYALTSIFLRKVTISRMFIDLTFKISSPGCILRLSISLNSF